MWLDGHRWHFDYIRLAWDTGFTFGNYTHSSFDRNKLVHVDVEQIVRERDVASIERLVPIVVQYSLENDQAEVLDSNFVKIFRIGQLAIEYLLFCKKYLDNTVVLYKKDVSQLKEENKQLKSYTEELESHISALTNHNNILTFKCEKCQKVFSNQDYLNAHFKRRHTEENTKLTSNENDFLQSEIKQLKERLNSTEKLVQEKQSQGSGNDQGKGSDTKVILEIQRKFDSFKEEMEIEIANLQMEKKNYEEKFGKLFDVMIQQKKDNVSKSSLNSSRDSLTAKDQNASECSPRKRNFLTEQVENSTQTDKSQLNVVLKEELVQTVSIDNNSKEVYYEPEEKSSPTKPDNGEKIEERITALGENIETKISSGLLNIENQMQSFWERLQSLETSNNIPREPHKENVQLTLPLPVNDDTSAELFKPRLKPRTKFLKPSTLPDEEQSQLETKKIKMILDKMVSEPKKTSVQAVRTLKVVESDFNSDSEPGSVEQAVRMNARRKKPIRNKLEFPKASEVKQVVPLKNQNRKSVIKYSNKQRRSFLGDVHNILEMRSYATGYTSIHTSFLEHTFDKAVHIVDLHKLKAKKMLPLRKSTKKDDLEPSKEIQPKLKKKQQQQKENKPNLIEIQYKAKPKVEESITTNDTPVVSIKNRSLYDTDSERDTATTKPTILNATQVALIKELKKKQAKLQAQKDNTDSDLTSIILTDDEKQHFQMKSAMKNHPAEGASVKKKVVFHVKATHENEGSSLKLDRKQENKSDGSSSDFEITDL